MQCFPRMLSKHNFRHKSRFSNLNSFNKSTGTLQFPCEPITLWNVKVLSSKIRPNFLTLRPTIKTKRRLTNFAVTTSPIFAVWGGCLVQNPNSFPHPDRSKSTGGTKENRVFSEISVGKTSEVIGWPWNEKKTLQIAFSSCFNKNAQNKAAVVGISLWAFQWEQHYFCVCCFFHFIIFLSSPTSAHLFKKAL